DTGALASRLHTGGRERQAGAGTSALAVDDRGDLTVGVMDCQPADQLDRGLVGAHALTTATDEADRQLAASAALPEDLDLGDVLGAADCDHDFAKQRAQQFLAVAVTCALGRPQLGQVARQSRERATLLVVERRGSRVLQCSERSLLARNPTERLLELGLPAAGRQSVLGRAGVELATRALSLELSPLECQAPTSQSTLVLLG